MTGDARLFVRALVQEIIAMTRWATAVTSIRFAAGRGVVPNTDIGAYNRSRNNFRYAQSLGDE
jgi:hypothetical protein